MCFPFIGHGQFRKEIISCALKLSVCFVPVFHSNSFEGLNIIYKDVPLLSKTASFIQYLRASVAFISGVISKLGSLLKLFLLPRTT